MAERLLFQQVGNLSRDLGHFPRKTCPFCFTTHQDFVHTPGSLHWLKLHGFFEDQAPTAGSAIRLSAPPHATNHEEAVRQTVSVLKRGGTAGLDCSCLHYAAGD